MLLSDLSACERS
ncbi:hypothetical protein D043_1339A, partial [Vibrio parahaemolyticus EKP-021]